jgi:hypothetical protein
MLTFVTMVAVVWGVDVDAAGVDASNAGHDTNNKAGVSICTVVLVVK